MDSHYKQQEKLEVQRAQANRNELVELIARAVREDGDARALQMEEPARLHDRPDKRAEGGVDAVPEVVGDVGRAVERTERFNDSGAHGDSPAE